MKKLFTKNLCIYMLGALLVTIACVFVYQTYICNRDNTANSYETLTVIEEKLAGNDRQIQQLTDSLGDNALAKSRAFAYIIKLDPDMIKDKELLLHVCELLKVDELHVIDENGIITHSTVDAYIGFDMDSGEQSAAFLPINEDPSLEIVQEPQMNATEGKIVQYIGVARQDAPGFVQVGVRPEVLENLLAGTSIDVVLKDYSVGDSGYVFAIDLESTEVLAAGNEAMVGLTAEEAGMSGLLGEGRGKTVIDGVSGYYVTQNYNEMSVGTFYPADEYYAMRISQTAVVVVCILIILFVLMLMINRLVSKQIVSGISNIAAQLQKIADGNLDIVVEENGNPEFQNLSANINGMVSNIKQNLSENEILMQQQEQDVKANKQLVSNIKHVCESIYHVSEETLNNAHSLLQGGTEQNEVILQLHSVMEELSHQLNENEEVSQNVSRYTADSVENIKETRNKMNLLADAINQIAEQSQQIEKIIGDIDSIASQTNMLSLNASIEAARAGEMGKGFAVVAGQVGELASKSTGAAKETNMLIGASMQAVERGKQIADEVVAEFMEVVKQIEQSGQNVEHISQLAHKQVKAVGEVTNKLEFISDVVEKNFTISKGSEHTAEALSQEAERLKELTGNS